MTEIRLYGFRVVRAEGETDRQTNKQTNRQTYSPQYCVNWCSVLMSVGLRQHCGGWAEAPRPKSITGRVRHSAESGQWSLMKPRWTAAAELNTSRPHYPAPPPIARTDSNDDFSLPPTMTNCLLAVPKCPSAENETNIKTSVHSWTIPIYYNTDNYNTDFLNLYGT